MFTLALVAFLAAVVVTRLAAVVHGDRPLIAPRSHSHEVDPRATRLV